MIRQKRSEFRMKYDLLNAIVQNEKVESLCISQIGSKANMGYDDAMKFIKIFMDNEIIESLKIKYGKTYRVVYVLTEKGKMLYTKLRQSVEFFDSSGIIF